MLELYHGGRTTCSRKVRLCLREKGLDYTSHLLNLRKFEQHQPGYLRLNPDGVVPTLVDDGTPIVESMLINEYIDEAFPEPALRSPSPLGRARMRRWTKLADSYGPMAVVPHSWAAFKTDLDKMSPEDLERAIARVPLKERRDRWSKAARGGFSGRDFDDSGEAAKLIVSQMEVGLCNGPWLLGDQYTLADVDLVPFVDRINSLHKDILNPTAAPKVSTWLARMHQRPAVIEVFSDSETPGSKAA